MSEKWFIVAGPSLNKIEKPAEKGLLQIQPALTFLCSDVRCSLLLKQTKQIWSKAPTTWEKDSYLVAKSQSKRNRFSTRGREIWEEDFPSN